jgi:hypothetical protein
MVTLKLGCSASMFLPMLGKRPKGAFFRADGDFQILIEWDHGYRLIATKGLK